MIAPPERSAERDAALAALLPLVGRYGWTMAALRRALAGSDLDPRDADLLFPGGAIELVEASLDRADREMEAAAGALAALRLQERVRGLIALRFAQTRPHREAVRRATALLALPQNLRVAARCTARTVEAIWFAAGDTAADFTWYTKRATLAGVYTTALLYWLRDEGDDDAATLAFLDRRLAGVARVGALLRKRPTHAAAPKVPDRSAA